MRSIPREIVGHLRVTAVEKSSSVDRDLIISFTHEQKEVGTAVVGTAQHAVHAGHAAASVHLQTCHLHQTIRLPSMCLVDRAHAEEFALQVSSRLAVEVQPSGKITHTLLLQK